ncbi:PP2C family protein-serine/threonine phosphatase [Streptomyces sp. PTD5-9]|uniref:PP2C family protein-serine/threonine phosphatase n=1 Tax=Streptomyces sp. PTD5-9 TaxID=3120150 RepID=UPI0030082F76
MRIGERFTSLRESWRPGHGLLVLPLALIALITVLDILSGKDVQLGPLLVIAPALSASFAGPTLTAVIGALAVAAETFIVQHLGVLETRNSAVQISAIAVLSTLTVFFCLARERRGRQLAQVRTVAEAAQQVLLWPLPERIGPLRVASLYLPAEDEALIGGDLYAITRVEGGTRVLIGDVRGKGLAAIGEAAVLLGAFREAAHQQTALPALASALERSVSRYQADFEPEGEAGEPFVTALLLEIPDEGTIGRMTSCGHPPPLLLGAGRSVTVPRLRPAPPLGVGALGPAQYPVDPFDFGDGDTLLLYTDGVIEARDRGGAFYPFAERAARWTDSSPEVLVHHLRRDLLAHVGGRLGDDAAVIAIRRQPVVAEPHPFVKAVHLDGVRGGAGDPVARADGDGPGASAA